MNRRVRQFNWNNIITMIFQVQQKDIDKKKRAWTVKRYQSFLWSKILSIFIRVFCLNIFFSTIYLDPRVSDWPMMSSPFPTIAICLFYAYFNKVLAPKIMANRKPFDLRNTLVIYNLFQTVFSTWIFYEVSLAYLLF